MKETRHTLKLTRNNVLDILRSIKRQYPQGQLIDDSITVIVAKYDVDVPMEVVKVN